MKQSSFIKINPADSVVVCLRPFKKGETINVDGKDIEVIGHPSRTQSAYQRRAGR